MDRDLRGTSRRRRGENVGTGYLSVLLCFLVIISPAAGAVMSIDLGSEWMKVAVVNLKPGQAPISIALNEMSKRKSPALVAFSNGERLLAEEAAGIIVRYPERVYSRVRDMVGKPVDSVKEMLDANYLPYDIVMDDRGAVNVRAADKQAVFRSEELLAMVLSYGRELAEAHSKSTIKDAVITVPPYMGQVERQGILDAAQIAGITVLALANEHSGAALQYGIDKDFANESRHVVFYDMGASSLYAALVYFSAYTGKDKGKTTTFNQFQVKGVRWDASLGGQTLEARLLDHFAVEFNKQVGGGFDVRKFPKAMAKLKKQVKRTKEILSANTEAPLSVEAIHDDRDFRSSITRQKFEEICGDLWERALVPLKEVLADTGLKVEDVYAFELIGGATRVPKLQGVLSAFLGKKGLDRHLDADEAVALGASLHAANLSDRVKLNRKFGMIDGASYSIVWKLEGASLNALEEADGDQVLIPRLKKLPSKVFKSLKNQKEDFRVSLQYHPSLLPPGITSPDLAAFQISGVADTAKKYASYNLSAPIKTNLHFSVSRSGLLYLDKAESVVEVSEWYEVPIKNITTSEANITGETKTTEESLETEQDSKEQDGRVLTDDGKIAAADASESPIGDSSSGADESLGDSTVAEPLIKRKLRKRTIRVPLKIKDQSKGLSQPLSSRAILEAATRLEKLQLRDAEKRRTAEAKNSLEAYIYATKDKLDSLDNIETVSTEKQRDALRAELSEAEDWLYMDGENASAAEFEKKLAALKRSGDAIFTRLLELEARPTAVQAARSFLQTIKETLEGWEKSKPWIPEKSRDEIAEQMQGVNCKQVRREVKALEKWLDDSEAKQQNLKGYDVPAFTSAEVYSEVARLQNLVATLNKLPKPRPPKAEKTTENITTEKKSSDAAADDTAKQRPSADEVIGDGVTPEQGIDGDHLQAEASEAQESETTSSYHDEL